MSLCLEPTTRRVPETIGCGETILFLALVAGAVFVLARVGWKLALTFF